MTNEQVVREHVYPLQLLIALKHKYARRTATAPVALVYKLAKSYVVLKP